MNNLHAGPHSRIFSNCYPLRACRDVQGTDMQPSVTSLSPSKQQQGHGGRQLVSSVFPLDTDRLPRVVLLVYV